MIINIFHNIPSRKKDGTVINFITNSLQSRTYLGLLDIRWERVRTLYRHLAITHLNQFNIRSWSFGWLTPETPKQTARTADFFDPDFVRASVITCTNVSLAAVSVFIDSKTIPSKIHQAINLIQYYVPLLQQIKLKYILPWGGNVCKGHNATRRRHNMTDFLIHYRNVWNFNIFAVVQTRPKTWN